MERVGPDDRAGYLEIGVTEGYDKWAAYYDRDANPLIAIKEGAVLELVGDVRGLRVLDAGCGTVRYCILLGKRGARVIGLDPSAGMLKQALPKKARVPFGVVQGTLGSACLADSTFDLVVCALTLNHVEDLEQVFREVTRVLRKGGWLIISDFHPYWIVFGHGYTEFFDDGQEYRIQCYPHLFEDYWRLCRKFGLHIEDLREPKIDARLIERFSIPGNYQDVPLAIILRLSYKGGHREGHAAARTQTGRGAAA
jgi:ubiquinone/menaquinone biosynthesis C-methylase UbiE